MRIIVGANIAHYGYNPVRIRPGACDNRMAYVLGLQKLGHEVYLFEDVDPKRCFDPQWNQVDFENWNGKDLFETLAKSYKIWPRCCMIYDSGRHTHGLSFPEVMKIAKTADLLINISGHLRNKQLLASVGCKAYIDIDPGKTQVYHYEYGVDVGLADHDLFFTTGLNIGDLESCNIPTCGLEWHSSHRPVVLSDWPSVTGLTRDRFTTISNWAGRHTFTFKGINSGEKSDNWLRFIELPQKTPQELEVALNIDPAYSADIDDFKANRWHLVDPSGFLSVNDYRSYIASSKAEFSVANDRCVVFTVGWVSDRTARYLAMGKPALVQATGLEGRLPTGKGLITFSTMDEAIAGIESINKNYAAHCNAARTIADEFFDSTKVLTTILKTAGF